MSDRDAIHRYLKSLSKYLSRLDKQEAEEVIREIESHIYDSIEFQQEDSEKYNIDSILGGLGEPRQLASQYVEHILKGMPPPSGFKALQIVKKGATKSLYYSMAIFGFGISLTLIIIGICKLYAPGSVGVWSAAQGNSIYITFSENMLIDSNELLGNWLVPIVIGLAVFIARMTKVVLRILKQHL